MEDLESIKEKVLDRIDYGTDVKLFSDIWEVLRDHVNIVRCKDCKHGCVCRDETGKDIVECFKTYSQKRLDWYCADGERK